MYSETIDQFAAAAAGKAAAIRANPAGFTMGAVLAGAYIGIAIILILSLGQMAEPAMRPLVMGLSFGLALLLVVFAGAELFTGHTMIMSLGVFGGSVGMSDLARSWVLTWLGNLAGSFIVAFVFWLGGGGSVLKQGSTLIFDVASAKMHAPALALLARGILCNWLVCLALWMSARAKSDTAKCILIAWCLFAFIASGFEHSVANMTVFSLALLGDHPDTVSLAGAAYNLFWVTLGNAIAGALFVAGSYAIASGRVAGLTPAKGVEAPEPAE